MRTNPFYDALLFITGQAGDYDPFGASRYLLVLLYDGLLLASIAIAITNLRQDRSQRSVRHAVIWLFRVLIGSMWLQGSLWKLPLPVSDGFLYWQQQTVENAAFPFYAAIMRDVFLAHINLLDPAVYLTETFMAAALILGFAVRLAGMVGVAMTLNLWIGLYHNQAEWPWEYIFLVVTSGFFVLDRAGRSLGLDALLPRRYPFLASGRSLLGNAHRLAS